MDRSEKETKEGEIGGKNETVLEKKKKKIYACRCVF